MIKWKYEVRRQKFKILEGTNYLFYLSHLMSYNQNKMLLSRRDVFERVKIYESSLMPKGAGMALPGIGIILHRGGAKKISLVRHEFGHILQSKQTGIIPFYFKIGIPSLISAMRNGKRGHQHHTYWTEVWADQLSTDYFGEVRSGNAKSE